MAALQTLEDVVFQPAEIVGTGSGKLHSYKEVIIHRKETGNVSFHFQHIILQR